MINLGSVESTLAVQIQLGSRPRKISKYEYVSYYNFLEDEQIILLYLMMLELDVKTTPSPISADVSLAVHSTDFLTTSATRAAPMGGLFFDNLTIIVVYEPTRENA